MSVRARSPSRAGGALSQSGAIVEAASAGLASFTAGAGTLVLTNTANVFTGTVSLTNAGANQNASLTNSVATDLGASNISGNLRVVSAGAITNSGALVSSGTGPQRFTTNAGNASITLNNPGNALGGAGGNDLVGGQRHRQCHARQHDGNDVSGGDDDRRKSECDGEWVDRGRCGFRRGHLDL